jgi:protein-tyrosine phosphatase
MNPRIRVLMVCTGNICRSPTAEAVLRRMLADARLDRQVEVESAGLVDYHAGSPPDHRAQQHAGRRGYDLSRIRARQIRARDFERFDLVLAMEQDHRDELISQCPQPLHDKVRLLMEFAPGHAGGTEVPDPYYGARDGFERVLDMVELACAGLREDLRRRLLDPDRP